LVDELAELPEQLWALVAGLLALRPDGRRDFIVVSGFALALTPMSNGDKLHGGVRRFVRRGAWRIPPAYWAALILFMVVTALLLRPGVEPAAPPPPPLPPDGCIPGPVITIIGSPTEPQRSELLDNTYHVHPNEWYASAPFAITNDGCLNFRISLSEIDVPLGGPVGAYPSIYKGCLWAHCTSNSGLPLTVAQVRNPGTVKTSTSTTLGAPGRWNSSYDIWFNRDPAPRSSDCSFKPSSTCRSMEMMIWLNHSPPNPGEPLGNPAGQLVASNVNLGRRTYNVWRVGGGRWQGDEGIVTYQITNYVTSVKDLDLAPLATDAVKRGYMTKNHHLLTVMHGFEIVRNGVGLSVDSYDVTVTPP
jgi:Glycosyl hydrolase family 12